LHVRCGTWDQVDVFLARKLRKGKFLSMKVPFVAKQGLAVTLGLELPNEVVMAIDGVVQKISPVEGDATRTWIEVELTGLNEEMLGRIRALGAKRAKNAAAKQESSPTQPPPLRKSASQVVDDLPADERDLFQHLTGELRRLRQAAVHDVLGVPREADAEAVRIAWRNLVRRYHPDLVARRGAPAISHLAEELTILANRAYDRQRSALVAEGRAAAAGPSVATLPGWLVGFDDIQSGGDKPAVPRQLRRAGSEGVAVAEKSGRQPRAATPPPIAPVAPAPAATGQGGEAFEQRARAMLAQGDADSAREVLAAALVVYPRSKPLRSLYYVASALAALHDGEVMLAQSQLETALAHHEQCVEAARLLDHIRKRGAADSDTIRKVFQ
jgi:hypothetical protein